MYLQGEKENKVAQRQLKDSTKENKSPPAIGSQSAFKPAGGASFQPIKPVPTGSKSSAFSGSGAFCPIPKKPEPKLEVSEPRIPTAFSSPATHFKPIVLQQTSAVANEKPLLNQDSKNSLNKEKEKTTVAKPLAEKKPVSESPDGGNDKEKEVVKKLKELKKNLMKHKQQPSMAKDIENEDGVVENVNKKSLPQIPKKSSSSASKSSDRSKRRQSSGALEALLKEIQKAGNVPDTNSLAAAIAGVLQNHLPQQGNSGASKAQASGGDSQSKVTPELDMTVTSAQASLNQGPLLQNLNIPQQFQSQLVGQTMSLPLQQFGGGLLTGLPQFQFQQDPVTGYMQLVPVGMAPMRPQSVHSNSGSAHSAPDFISPSGSGPVMKDVSSPEMSPKVYHPQSDLNNSAISDSSRGKPAHGRTAKDLVQKTANLRAKNLGRPSPSNLSVPQPGSVGMQKWRSDHALDVRNEPAFYSDSEKSKHASYSSLSFSNKLSAGFVYDDTSLHPGSYRHPAIPRPHSQYGQPMYRTPDDRDRQIGSTMSSPSPSTHDSGIGGMNHGVFRSVAPASDTSLMDRLLSNVNPKQQRILGRIVHLLREEFAFDGYMENGVEDVAMGEL